MSIVNQPLPTFFEKTGEPLDQGYIYIGLEDQNPETSPKAVYWDEALTIPAVQPLRTLGGYIVRNGSPARVYTNGQFSQTVRNRKSQLVYTQAKGDVLSDYGAAAALRADLLSTAAGKGQTLVSYPVTAQETAAGVTIVHAYRQPGDVRRYGAVGDGIFVAGGAASGTDNLAAFTAAFAVAAISGQEINLPSGFFFISSKLTLPTGVRVRGEGTAWLPGVLSGNKDGTALLINGAAAGDCFAFAENGAHAGLSNLSVFNTNTNAIRSVVSVVGHLYARLQNVEIASLRPTSGAAIYVGASASAPNYETLWAEFEGVITPVTDVDLSTEASHAWGLRVYGTSSVRRPNANAWRGGQLAGTQGPLLADGAAAGSGALSWAFTGTKFDLNYPASGGHTPRFCAAAAKVFGYEKASCYIVPSIKLLRAHAWEFFGCYIEAAGVPATYNDGFNGSAPLIAVAWLDDPSEVTKTSINGMSWNGVYLYDNAALTMTDPTTSGQRHTTRSPAALSVRASGTQSIPTATWTKVQLGTVVAGDDSELEWDAANNRGVIRSSGLYLISAQADYSAGWSTSGTFATMRVVAGGYSFTGNTVGQLGSGAAITPQATIPAVQLLRGDTVHLDTLHNQGGTQLVGGSNTYISIVKLG